MGTSDLETLRLTKPPASARPHRWRLVVVTEDGASSHALPEKGELLLGRGDDAGLKLDDVSVSRRHAVLHLGPPVVLEDLGSANGSTVRGRKLGEKESVALAAFDTVELGGTLLVLQPDELSGESRPWTLVTHQRFVETVARAQAPFAVLRLQVLAPPGVAQEVLSSVLASQDTVASFGPGQFEVLSPGLGPDAARGVMEKLSSWLVAAGARVRAGCATAPQDGAGAEELIASCARPATAPAPGFLVRDDAMATLYRLLDRVAPSGISVLLLGETGVGKEVLASELHRRSRRAKGPFLRLNCAALTESLLESELFGHEKGSFTGAVKQKDGLLEAARGGTVLLDEVGELPPSVQAKLLRVLEERQVLRVGAVKPEPIDVRFVFATNRDLEAEVARGAFRADLYYRVNGLSIVIPPLRERLAEVEPLAQKFAAEAAQREARPAPELSGGAVAALEAWHWPGNIRELKNVIERAVLLSGEGVITAQALGLGSTSDAAASRPSAAAPASLKDEREAAEKRAVLEALEKTQGNQTKAAALLGVSRRTLVTRLQQYGLTRSRPKPGA